jgi:hypothetical protein
MQTTEYRGYAIEVAHRDKNLLVSIHPTRCELPILRFRSFVTLPYHEGEALKEAKRRIDRLLS